MFLISHTLKANYLNSYARALLGKNTSIVSYPSCCHRQSWGTCLGSHLYYYGPETGMTFVIYVHDKDSHWVATWIGDKGRNMINVQVIMLLKIYSLSRSFGYFGWSERKMLTVPGYRVDTVTFDQPGTGLAVDADYTLVHCHFQGVLKRKQVKK